MRAAFYGRFSTDRQRETSIADQAHICAARAVALGLTLEIQHSDEGISGSTPVMARPGGKQLLADALAGRFDVLIIEGLDRLSRDMVEQEQVIRRLEHRGVRIIGVSDGYDSDSSARKLHRGMRGLINEVYLDDLRAKTHRGLAGQVGRGMHAGGLSYGYRSVPADGGHRLEVEPTAAGWVRWIFQHYADGWSVQRIAHELNRLGVPSLRGGTWAVSAIYGNPLRLAGVLNNELYIGRYIWNRSQWIKDPDTGKRIRVDRPRDEWSVRDMPELRILPDELWQAVRDRMSSTRLEGGRGRGGKPSTLFGGLLRCVHCGGPVVAISGSTYGCAARKDRGQHVCPGVRTPRMATDKRLLGLIRDDLLSPEAFAFLQAEISTLMDESRRAARHAASNWRLRLAEIDNEIERLTDAIAQMGFSPALAERLKEAERMKAKIQADAAPKPRSSVDAAAAVERYRRMLLDLEAAVSKDIERARKLVSQILGAITIENVDDQTWAILRPESEQGRLLLAAGLDSRSGCGDPLRHLERKIRIV